MTTIDQLVEYFGKQTPFELAESWDNVGLLVGDQTRAVSKIMTCLTITNDVVDEAIQNNVDVIVTHHPLPFQALKKITSETTTGQLLLALIESKVAVISPHTGFDSARLGINQMLAQNLGLIDICPLDQVDPQDAFVGKGRFGKLSTPTKVEDFAQCVKKFLGIDTIKTVYRDGQMLLTVGVACGSGGSFLEDAIAKKCDAFVTGEATFHTCLEARSRGIALILLGHFESERFALDELAKQLEHSFPDTQCWASQNEFNPIRWF